MIYRNVVLSLFCIFSQLYSYTQVGVEVNEYQMCGSDVYKFNTWSALERDSSTSIPSSRGNDYFSHTYEKEIKRAKSCGMDQFFVTLEWSDLEPICGEYNQQSFHRIYHIVSRILQAGLKPCITLVDGTLPIWFEDKGGFSHKKNNDYFRSYAAKVGATLQDLDCDIITFRDVGKWSYKNTLSSSFEGGKSYSISSYLDNVVNKLHAHTIAYETIKAVSPKKNVGIGHSFITECCDSDWGILSKAHAAYYNYFICDAVTKALLTKSFFFVIPLYVYVEEVFAGSDQKWFDFVSIHYDTVDAVSFNSVGGNMLSFTHEKRSVKDMYGDIMSIKKSLAHLNVPLYLSLHSSATTEKRHSDFLEMMLHVIRKDIFEVVTYRPFIDSYEWEEGFSNPSGLFSVDRETQSIRLRESSTSFISEIIDRKSKKLAVIKTPEQPVVPDEVKKRVTLKPGSKIPRIISSTM